jgi:biopolymer transport protein ExbB
MDQQFGFAHFFLDTDEVGKGVLFLLLALSMASWYLIMTKAIANTLAKRRAEKFLKLFWVADSLQEVYDTLHKHPVDNAFAELAHQALHAIDNGRGAGENGRGSGASKLIAAGGLNEYITRVLRNCIDQEASRVENGLTVLASAGSAAPFIGLFGTVWAIYHALVQIGLSGQGTLEKVAGPVGEALIMTAVGLAVAIPAVLAYNALTRRNRVWLARLDAFAHDIYSMIAVGEKANSSAALKLSVVRQG